MYIYLTSVISNIVKSDPIIYFVRPKKFGILQEFCSSQSFCKIFLTEV